MPVKEPYCVQCKHHFVEITPQKVVKGRWWPQTYQIEEQRMHMCSALANLITGEPILRTCSLMRGHEDACGRSGKLFERSGKLFEDGTQEQA